MNIRFRYFLCICSVILFACNDNRSGDNSDQGKDTLETEEPEIVRAPQLRTMFPQIYLYFAAQDSSFSESSFTGGETDMKDTMAPVPINGVQLQPYIPFLVFNSSDSLAIDFVSYNYLFSKKGGKTVLQPGGPDTEVALIDFRNNTRKRILFLGSSGTVLDAGWEDDNTVVLVTALETGEGQIAPALVRYHTNTGIYEMYSYSGNIKADIRNYTEERLNERLRTIPAS